jgi:diguanylate cyclase (GGDEF)-like protein/PAS domain S-box-containing protein
VGPSSARAAAATFIVASALYALLPPGSAGRATVYLLVAVAALARAARGYRGLPGDRRPPWAPVVAAVLLLVLTDLVLTGLRLAGTPAPWSHPLRVLYSVGAVALALGVVAMVRQGARPDRGALLDALMVTASTGMVVWVLVIGPLGAGEFAGDPAGLAQLLVYSATHLFLLVAAIRFALSSPWTSAAGRRLLAGALALPLAAASLGLLLTLGHYGPGSAIDLVWLGTYLLLSESVRHASAAGLAAPRRRENAVAGKLVLIAVVLMHLPVLHLVMARTTTEVAVAVATAVLLALITARVGMLLRDGRLSHGTRLRLERERSHRRLSALLRHASDVMLVLDRHDQVVHATASATQLLGQDPTGLSSEQLLRQIHPTDRAEVRRRLAEGDTRASPQPVRSQARLADRSRQRYVEVVVADLRDDPDVRGTVVTLHDITERVELERRLRHLAFHDALTGLCNRELFQDRLDLALRRARREHRHVAVLLCDLDDFKNVNDTHGHATGDAFLRHVADRLLGAARDSDTVARLGGDEFAIVCEGIERTQDAVEVARRILTATAEPVTISDREFLVGVSLGIAIDDGSRSAEELLRDADIALYEAKADGKQRWALHEQAMTVRALQRLQLETDLIRAVEEGRIQTVYQPIVTLDEQRIVAVEALARWEHPEHGWISPCDFIPIAERSDLIVALGDAVLDDALCTLRGWLDERPDLLLQVGVNVSARQLRDPGLPHRLERRLRELELDPSLLVLELTESVLLEGADLAIDVMHRLRRIGVHFAVDDFGTGYSSLAYLQRLPVSVVKTDRAFVNALGVDDGADQLVRAIMEMARSMHLDVVAEGIETIDQHDLLVELGCVFGQGFRFAHPVPASVLRPRLLSPDALVTTQPADVLATDDDEGPLAPRSLRIAP